MNKNDAKGRLDDLAGRLREVSSSALVEEHARSVREKALLRRLIEAGEAVSRMASEPGEEVDRILDQAGKLIFEVGRDLHSGQTRRVTEILYDVYEKLQLMRSRGSRYTGLPTGFEDLDDLTTGFHPGELVIIAGRPSMGKTSFANNIIERVSVRNRRPTAIFSLEVSSEQVVQNILCIHARFDAQDFRRGRVSNTDFDLIQRATDDLYKAPIVVDDTQGLTAMGLRHKARRLKQTDKIELLIVDYLQLMEADSMRGSENRQQEISRISRSLKSLARELKIPVIALSQLNRLVEQRDDHRPRMSDLRESGSIEQDADVVLLLHREEYFKQTPQNEKIAEVIVAKQRNGPTDTIRLQFERRCMRFDSLARGNAPDTTV
mgnify:CR=1 FL=1